MPIVKLHAALGRIFYQRCFYLFVAIVALIALAPFAMDTREGRIVLQFVHVAVLVSAVAAVGRTIFPFVLGLLLGLPALGFQLAVLVAGLDPAFHTEMSVAFYLAFYVVVLSYLLHYVFSPNVMTDDKLFGAAAAYMLLGVAWTAAYQLVQFHAPGAFGVKPGEPPRSFFDLLYMSFGCLTSNGPGDIVPNGSKVRVLVILEQVSGTLFTAILIARLAGIYPRRERESR